MGVPTVSYALPGDLTPSLGLSNWCPDELLILTVAAELGGLCPCLAEERGGLSKFSGPG